VLDINPLGIGPRWNISTEWPSWRAQKAGFMPAISITVAQVCRMLQGLR